MSAATRWPETRARNGAVAIPHALASDAGLAVLRAGGNALDAALAAVATLAVVYPHMNDVRGDNVWLLHDAARGRLRALNGTAHRRGCPAGAPDRAGTGRNPGVGGPAAGHGGGAGPVRHPRPRGRPPHAVAAPPPGPVGGRTHGRSRAGSDARGCHARRRGRVPSWRGSMYLVPTKALRVESRFDETVAGRLRERAYRVRVVQPWSDLMGHAQVIAVDADGLRAGSDPRADGAAKGW